MSINAVTSPNIEQVSAERAAQVRAKRPAARLNVGRVYIVGASFASRVDLRGQGVDAVAIAIEYPQQIDGICFQIRLNES